MTTYRNRRILARTGTAGLLLALGMTALGTTAPAQAETTRYLDWRDTPASSADIVDTVLMHRKNHVVVRTDYDRLDRRPNGSPSTTLFLDTRRGGGPEFALSTGLAHGTDYALRRVRRWKPVGKPLTCDHDVRISWRKDATVMTFKRGCLGNPKAVRVAQQSTDHPTPARTVIDWMKGRHRYTTWAARG